MATRKATPSKGKGKSREELRRQLARDITSVLANPECPTIIYNDLASAVLEIFNTIPTFNLDTSEAYAAAQEKGGTR
jgi:hypothetical protein